LNRSLTAAGAAVAVFFSAACSDRVPTLPGEGFLPVQPTTVELRIPFSEFASELRVVGGFGSPAELGTGVVALDPGGAPLRARTVLRLNTFPSSAQVLDAGGVTQADTLLSFIGGQLLVRFDSLRFIAPGPVTVAARALEGPRWDPITTTWTAAVDSAGTQRIQWPEPGAGPSRLLGTGQWNPGEGDSLLIRIDSASVAALGDTANAGRGLRLDSETSGTRLRVRSVSLLLEAVPSIRPDTLLELPVSSRDVSFIFDPRPTPAPDELRVGGTPAWRTFFQVAVPTRIEPPSPVCQRLSCPVDITPESVVFAALVMQSATGPASFMPLDTVAMEVRPVLDPSRLPRSPLGSSLLPLGRILDPGWFLPGGGRTVTLPVTSFVRDRVRGTTAAGDPAPTGLALLLGGEPVDFAFNTFDGPGRPGEPFLRILLTLADGVTLP